MRVLNKQLGRPESHQAQVVDGEPKKKKRKKEQGKERPAPQSSGYYTQQAPVQAK